MDPGRLIEFFPTKISSDPGQAKLQGFSLSKGLQGSLTICPAYLKVHKDPDFGNLTENFCFLYKY